MKHSSCVILDTYLRQAWWYPLRTFPLSDALKASARLKNVCAVYEQDLFGPQATHHQRMKSHHH